MKWVGVIGAAVFACSVDCAAQPRFCAIQPPMIQATVSGAVLNTVIHCDTTKADPAVSYPDAALWVGATVVTLPANVKQDTISTELPEQANDLPPVAIMPGQLTADVPVSFKIDAIGNYSHVILAVWTTKIDCGKDNDYRYVDNGCRKYGYNFGSIDDDEYPAPVDAWPRPRCDIPALKTAGFFRMGKDPTNLPRRLQGLAKLNDCWNLVSGPGLGYSIRHWRFAPIAPLTHAP